jgi:hypothetical protein
MLAAEGAGPLRKEQAKTLRVLDVEAESPLDTSLLEPVLELFSSTNFTILPCPSIARPFHNGVQALRQPPRGTVTGRPRSPASAGSSSS